jgi:hypothetical protein
MMVIMKNATTVNLKIYKFLDVDHILAEPIQAGGESLLSETHKLIHSIWNREELPIQWKESNFANIQRGRQN